MPEKAELSLFCVSLGVKRKEEGSGSSDDLRARHVSVKRVSVKRGMFRLSDKGEN